MVLMALIECCLNGDHAEDKQKTTQLLIIEELNPRLIQLINVVQ